MHDPSWASVHMRLTAIFCAVERSEEGRDSVIRKPRSAHTRTRLQIHSLRSTHSDVNAQSRGLTQSVSLTALQVFTITVNEFYRVST